MCLDHLALLILVSLSRTTLSEVTIGATKDCEKVTSGQATFPAKFTSFEACCVKEASKLSDAEIKYASKEKCCIPPGAACSQEDGRIPCCNQLSCLKNGAPSAKCQQRSKTYLVDDIRVDKVSCVDVKKPVHVLIDFTLKRKDKGDLTLKDVSYCCDNNFKSKTRIARIEKHCCGTGFAICDDLSKPYRKYPIMLKCCGDESLKKQYNCGSQPVNGVTDGPMPIYQIQNEKYLSKKTGKSVKDVEPAPNPLQHGYGFCSYARSGRFDLTKDLSKNTGSDILALCKEGKTRSGKENDIKCPGNKKVMYQFQSNTNICCTKSGHMHRSEDEEIHKDCCINNLMHPGMLEIFEPYPISKYKQNYCKKIPRMPCCSGKCYQDPACYRGESSGGFKKCKIFQQPALCEVRNNETVVKCEGDYLFSPDDQEYAKVTDK